MRTLALFIVVLVCGIVGCGNSDKPNNSNIQSPNDQPIAGPNAVGSPAPNGGPQPIGGPQVLNGTKAPQLGKGSDNKGGKPLPIVEIKQ